MIENTDVIVIADGYAGVMAAHRRDAAWRHGGGRSPGEAPAPTVGRDRRRERRLPGHPVPRPGAGRERQRPPTRALPQVVNQPPVASKAHVFTTDSAAGRGDGLISRHSWICTDSKGGTEPCTEYAPQ
jgi:hypothetical protein